MSKVDDCVFLTIPKSRRDGRRTENLSIAIRIDRKRFIIFYSSISRGFYGYTQTGELF